MRAKKLLSLLLVCVMLVGLFPASVFAASYGDTQGHWAQTAIERWSDYGIVTGDGQGFRPNDNMTRAEAATVFSRLFGLSDAAAKTTFTDVAAKDWFYEAVNKCVNAGIMNGVGDNMMNPNGTMTREMFFVMFARALGIKEQSATKGLPADGDSWANGYINALTDKGFVQGMDGKVNALANINRASVMALLDQTIKQYVNASGTTTLSADKGVVLVNAKNVTLTGTTAADIVIAQGADGGNVDFVKATVTGVVTAQAADAKITSDKDSKITTPVINGANTTYMAAGAATVSGGSGGYSGGGSVDPAAQAPKVKGDLSDEVYTGDLTIGTEFGDGDVTLERVTVDGKLYVLGGGKNSVHLKDCTINEIVVNKPESAGTEETRLALEGTSPKAITASSGTIIAAPSGNVTVGAVTANSAVTLTGAASVDAVTADGSSAEVVLDKSYSGSVSKVEASGSAKLTAESGTTGTVAVVAASGGATIGGSSETAIQSVKASGAVTIDAKVATVEAADNATLTLGASADVADVTAEGSLTVSAASGDAGKIGTLTATTGTITVAAPTAQIAKVEAKAVENGTTDNNTVAITVTSGTVSEVVASAANTTVSGGDKGTVANVTANNKVSVDAKTVEKVTVATTETITVDDTASGTSSKIDVAVTGGTAVNLEASSSAVSAIEVSADSETADVSNVKITNTTTNVTTAVTHVHTWSTEPTSTESATCVSNGKAVYTCQTLGCTAGAGETPLTKTVVIPATGEHTWNDGVVTSAETCTTAGVKTYTCTVSGCGHTKTEPIPAHGHTPTHSFTKTNWTDAYRDETSHWNACSTCNEKIYKSAHNYANVVSVKDNVVTVMPTCTVCGYEDEAHKKEASTLAYIQLAYTEKDGVKTIEGNDLKNSNNRDFYSAGTTPATQTLTLYSTVELAGAATTASNWDVKDGAGNALTCLTLTSVAKNDNVTVGKTIFYSYTLTFTPQDVDKDTAGNQYSVSGALRITPNDAALGKVENAQVTLANSEGYVKAGVPAPAAVASYAVSVDHYGVATATETVALTEEEIAQSESGATTKQVALGSGATYYLVDSTVNASKKMSDLAKSTYKTTTEEQVEAALGVTGKDVATAKRVELSELSELKGVKTNNGKYLVAVKYTNDQLDGYGVSGAIRVYGDTPETLIPTVDTMGMVGANKVTTTTATDTNGVTTSTTKIEELKSGVTYYLVNGEKPALSLDTLDNEDALEKALGPRTTPGEDGKPETVNWEKFTEQRGLTNADNGKYLIAVVYGTTKSSLDDTVTFGDRVAAFGMIKVTIKTAGLAKVEAIDSSNKPESYSEEIWTQNVEVEKVAGTYESSSHTTFNTTYTVNVHDAIPLTFADNVIGMKLTGAGQWGFPDSYGGVYVLKVSVPEGAEEVKINGAPPTQLVELDDENFFYYVVGIPTGWQSEDGEAPDLALLTLSYKLGGVDYNEYFLQAVYDTDLTAYAVQASVEAINSSNKPAPYSEEIWTQNVEVEEDAGTYESSSQSKIFNTTHTVKVYDAVPLTFADNVIGKKLTGTGQWGFPDSYGGVYVLKVTVPEGATSVKINGAPPTQLVEPDGDHFFYYVVGIPTGWESKDGEAPDLALLTLSYQVRKITYNEFFKQAVYDTDLSVQTATLLSELVTANDEAGKTIILNAITGEAGAPTTFTAKVEGESTPCTVTLDSVTLNKAKLVLANEETYAAVMAAGQQDLSITVKEGAELYIGEQPVFFKAGTEATNGGTQLTKGAVVLDLKNKIVQFQPGAEATIYGWPDDWIAEIMHRAKVTLDSENAVANMNADKHICVRAGGELYVGEEPAVTATDKKEGIYLASGEVVLVPGHANEENGAKKLLVFQPNGEYGDNENENAVATVYGWNEGWHAIVQENSTILVPSQERAAALLSSLSADFSANSKLGIGTKDSYYLILGPDTETEHVGDHYLAMVGLSGQPCVAFGGNVIRIVGQATVPAGKTWTTNWDGKNSYIVVVNDHGGNLTVNGTMNLDSELYVFGSLNVTGTINLIDKDALVKVYAENETVATLIDKVKSKVPGWIVGQDSGEEGDDNYGLFTLLPEVVTQIIPANIATPETYKQVIQDLENFELDQDLAASYFWEEKGTAYTEYDVHGTFHVGNIAKHATSSEAEPSWWVGVAIPQEVITSVFGSAASVQVYTGYTLPDESSNFGSVENKLNLQEGSYMVQDHESEKYYTHDFNAVKASANEEPCFIVLRAEDEHSVKMVFYVIEFTGVEQKETSLESYLATAGENDAILLDYDDSEYVVCTQPEGSGDPINQTTLESIVEKSNDEKALSVSQKLIVTSKALAQMATDEVKLNLTGSGELFLADGENPVVTADNKTLGQFFNKESMSGLCFQIGGFTAMLDANNGLSNTTLLADFARMVYHNAGYENTKNAMLGFMTEDDFVPSGWTHSMVIDLVNVLGESLEFESLEATVMELDDSFTQNNTGVSGTVYALNASNTTTKTYRVQFNNPRAATLDVSDASKLFFQCTAQGTGYAVLAIKMPAGEVTVTQTNPALETAYENDLENEDHASWWTLADPESNEYIKSKNTNFTAEDCYYCLLLKSNTEVTVTAELDGVRTTYLITVPSIADVQSSDD